MVGGSGLRAAGGALSRSGVRPGLVVIERENGSVRPIWSAIRFAYRWTTGEVYEPLQNAKRTAMSS